MKEGHVIWLTGISGAGKSTLAHRLLLEFQKREIPVEILDGDEIRAFFESDLGYTRKERMLNVRRIAFAAHLLSKHGVNVIVANIAPYYEVRDFIRRKIPNYFQVYVEASDEVVKKRDVKGFYKKVANGLMSNMVGQDDVYDIPRRPDIVVRTDRQSIEESFVKIKEALIEKEILTYE